MVCNDSVEEVLTAFAGLFSNKRLRGAVLLSLVLQVAVIYTPFLQQTFSIVSLSARDWLRRSGKLGAVAARIEQTCHTCNEPREIRILH